LSSARALYFLKDVDGFRGPDKRLWISVVRVNVLGDGRVQVLDAVEDSAAQLIDCVRSRKKRSTMFSHDELVGVKWQ